MLLARLPTLEHARLAGHTGGNLLLSMMERYSGDFLAHGIASIVMAFDPDRIVRLGVIGAGLAFKWLHWPALQRLAGNS